MKVKRVSVIRQDLLDQASQLLRRKQILHFSDSVGHGDSHSFSLAPVHKVLELPDFFHEVLFAILSQ
jgi:hypothetical protein